MKHIDRHEKNISIWNDFVNCVDVQIVGAGLQNETKHRYNADGFNPTNTIQYVAKGRGFIEIAGKKAPRLSGLYFSCARHDALPLLLGRHRSLSLLLAYVSRRICQFTIKADRAFPRISRSRNKEQAPHPLFCQGL